MEENKGMWENLLKAERKARASKLRRLLSQPLLYPALMIFDYAIYPYTHRSKSIYTDTFFGIRMKTVLPSGTDISLHRIKAHDSELRFAKFLLRHLKQNDVFVDVGAHYGYYSLLAVALIGSKGHVYAVEASAASTAILKENTAGYSNVTIIQAAASDTPGHITFYEYPVPYAECNTTVKDAYAGKKWVEKIQQIENHVPTVLMDDLLAKEGITKAMFKIDAEGGETAVLRGMVNSLKTMDLCVVMEYHHTPGKISIHEEAVRVLKDCGYNANGIDIDGNVFPVPDITRYLEEKKLESDNLVFRKA
ncbi:MAG TPA: FkbM family methyltransferase [Saprospiraceae bacterium]